MRFILLTTQRALFTIVMVFSGAAVAQSSYEDLRSWSQGFFRATPEELCVQFNSPIDFSGQPNPPFVISEEKTQLRRDAAIETSEAQSGYFSPNSKAIALAEETSEWLYSLKQQLQLVGNAPNLLVIDQFQLCLDQTDALFQEVDTSKLEPSVRKDVLSARLNLQSQCLSKNYAIANFAEDQIYIGDFTLNRLSPLQRKIVLSHELCHVQYPAIERSSKEEFFCDAVAHLWLKKILSEKEFDQVALAHQIALDQNSATSEFLKLRASLPMYCKALRTEGGL